MSSCTACCERLVSTGGLCEGDGARKGERNFGRAKSSTVDTKGDKCTTVCKVCGIECSECNASLCKISRTDGPGWLAFVIALKLQDSLQITTGICGHVINSALCISAFPGVVSKRQTIR